MSVTRNDLVALVNDELENVATDGIAETVSDGITNSYLIAPMGYYVLEGSVFAALSDSPTSAYTMDYETSAITFTDTPAGGVTVYITYKYLYWRTRLVEQAINAAIDNLFPAFYVPKADTSILLVADSYEYALPPATQFITAVETRSATTGAYTKMARSKYEWLSDGDHLTLRFFGPPTGFMRVRCINRPAPLTDTSSTLETTAGLPARAKDPIISYACWYLLTQKIAPRIRSDIAVNTQGVGTLSPRQIADGTQAWMMRYQLQLAAERMPPWMSR